MVTIVLLVQQHMLFLKNPSGNTFQVFFFVITTPSHHRIKSHLNQNPFLRPRKFYFQLFNEISFSIPSFCNMLLRPYIPDIVNLLLKKPSQAMTNSPWDHGWGVGRVDWLTCLFIYEVARATGIAPLWWVQCFQSEIRGITGNMTWHSCWTRPLSSFLLLSLSFSPPRDIFSCGAAPPLSMQPEWHYHHN